MNHVDSLLLFDPLSLFFLGVIALVSFPSAIYSPAYFRGVYAPGQMRLAWSLMLLFVLSMALVVSVRHVLAFLVVWEIMSLVSYGLVVFDTTHERSVQAGLIYIVMTHIGTAFLTAAFLLVYRHAHSFDILAIREACAAMPAQVRSVVFLFFLVGFGTKAGIVPLHIWLPYAHPQAPTPVSSIMSGVMIKTAVYGLIRFVIFVLGADTFWWGVLVLVLAVVSCLVGVIYALMEHDIKKLLAYSSVENIGIIFLGVGLAMLFLSAHKPFLAVFSLIAGLYHLVNHAIFKSLLFLCAGSVYKSTGTRHIEKLGGLIKKMPHTAAYFLCGAMAVSALPPLNGFVSEWLTLQAFFLGALHVGAETKLFFGLGAAMLVLTSGLTAACFVKAFGVTFLALARSRHADEAKEVPLSMRISMLFLSSLTVIFGLGAVTVIRLLAKVAGAATGVDTESMSFSLNPAVAALPMGRGAYLSVPLLAAALGALGLAGFLAYRLFSRERAMVYKTWDCGYDSLSARHEYTATAFSKPFRVAFSFFLQPYRRTQKIRESFYHVKSFSYETHTTPVFKKYIYGPTLSLIFRSARSMRRIQPGSIHVYLAYIFVTVLLLIAFMHKF